MGGNKVELNIERAKIDDAKILVTYTKMLIPKMKI